MIPQPSKLDSILASQNFDPTISYQVPICLHFRGKPLLVIGQNVKQLDSNFSFRYDPNGEYENYFGIVTDYLSLDDSFSADFSTGALHGSLFFSADSSGRIFRLDANWGISEEMLDSSGVEIMNYFHVKLFPCLPNIFWSTREYELKHQHFTEKFTLHRQAEDVCHNWILGYSIELRKKDSLE